jgi:hypothetical protein
MPAVCRSTTLPAGMWGATSFPETTSEPGVAAVAPESGHRSDPSLAVQMYNPHT